MSDIVILPFPQKKQKKKSSQRYNIHYILFVFNFFQMNKFIPKFIFQSSQNLIAFTPNFMNESKLYIYISLVTISFTSP